MTIGYVLDDTLDSSDGVQQAVIAIAEKARSLGHDVHYIVPYTERTDLQNIHSIAKVVSLKFNGNSVRTPVWTSTKAVKKLFADVAFDVLHVQMPYSPVMAARVIKRAPASTKIVGTFHILPYGFWSQKGTKFLGWILRRTNQRISKAYAVSQPALDFMSQDFGINGEVLGNPVNYEFFNSFVSKKQDASKKQIVFVGRFDERKGVRQLAQAYRLLPMRSETELVMCGKGPLYQEVSEYSERHGLNIKMPGFVSEEDKARYLASADIAVFPSTGGESFGIVLIEAMSAGAGVTLGGNNPGYASVMQEWPESLFNPDNIQEFTAKLEIFLNDDSLKARVGKSQHEGVTRYDINLITDRLLKEAYI